MTLLADRSGSTAWEDWHKVAGLTFRNRLDVLTIADPNVRVQTVIDGQGIALNDALVENELKLGQLARLTDHELSEYGYFLAFEPHAMRNPDIAAFAGWLMQMAASSTKPPGGPG